MAWIISDNPFEALAVAAKVANKEDELKGVLLGLDKWQGVDVGNFFDDLMQEIAGATNIVVQQTPDGSFRAIHED